MALPKDEQDAIRSASVIDQETLAIQAGLQADYTPTGKFVLKRWETQRIHGISAGQVFYQMILNTINSGKPNFRKSVYSVAESLFGGKDLAGKTYPISGDNLRKRTFPKFISAPHLWASYGFLTPEEQLHAFVEIQIFYKFMTGAECLRRIAIDLRLPTLVDSMSDWDPWCPHPVFGEIIETGDFEFEFPGEDDRLSSKLLEYKHKPYETN